MVSCSTLRVRSGLGLGISTARQVVPDVVSRTAMRGYWLHVGALHHLVRRERPTGMHQWVMCWNLGKV